MNHRVLLVSLQAEQLSEEQIAGADTLHSIYNVLLILTYKMLSFEGYLSV